MQISSRFLTTLLSLGLLALVLTACSPEDQTEQVGRSDRSSAVASHEVSPRDLSRELSLSGRVEPRVVLTLASRTAGTIEAVDVEAGDPVEEGDVLARIDTDEIEAELRRAEAEQQRARLDLERIERLRAQDVSTETELQNARAAFQVTESEVLLWRTRLAYGDIRAPRNAVITARHIEAGESVQTQTPLFELAAMDELVMRLGVTERDVVHLEPGDELPIQMDALPQLTLTGEIRRILPNARADHRLTTIELALPEEAASLGVRTGFMGRIRTAIDVRRERLAIPSHMLGMQRGQPYVYRIVDGELVRANVETGVTRGDWTEIIDGLSDGDIILGSSPMDLREGQSVRVVSQWGNDG